MVQRTFDQGKTTLPPQTEKVRAPSRVFTAILKSCRFWRSPSTACSSECLSGPHNRVWKESHQPPAPYRYSARRRDRRRRFLPHRPKVRLLPAHRAVRSPHRAARLAPSAAGREPRRRKTLTLYDSLWPCMAYRMGNLGFGWIWVCCSKGRQLDFSDEKPDRHHLPDRCPSR